MQTIVDILSSKFLSALHKSFPELKDSAINPEIVQSTQEKFGHYQCNMSMKLSKIVRLPPRDISSKLIENLDIHTEGGNNDSSAMLLPPTVAGPGFINLSLTPQFLAHHVNAMLLGDRLNIVKDAPKKIIIDFSSPNTAKEMHVGHLRSTIIGDCLARLFEFLGHDVLRLNHIGDWGTSFGMLIAYMKDECPQVLTGAEPTDLTHLVAWYRAAKLKFDADPEFKKRSQQEVVRLQNGNAEALKAWKIICDISRRAYQEIYDLLDIKIIERGESFYNPDLASTVDDLTQKGLVTLSNGAKCIFLNDKGDGEGFQNRQGESLPLMVQKSDGGYNYDTTDMAAIRHRIDIEKGDRLIYVTDAGQAQHFQMIFKAAEKAGYLDPKKVRVDHVPFGLVLGGDGKKFRTRSGETERLIDLLTSAIDQADKIIAERSPTMPEQERHVLAKALGVGAVKYADLSTHRCSDYTFSYERMLKFEGNTAAFIMYSYVRVHGIKRKINIDVEALMREESISLQHPSEIALGLHLAQFPETLSIVAEDLLPNRLTDYLYTLAEKFNAFFRDCRVEGASEQASRLLLCEVVARVLKQGLDILGLHTVERM